MSNLDESKAVLSHDINSTLSSLLSALELMSDEWKKNPELVDKILPLTEQKLSLLKEQLILYRNTKN
nr:hypothetical protein BHI3_34760 [Bacteriovorax sp. HI3]